MKTHEITVTLRVASKSSVSRLEEVIPCLLTGNEFVHSEGRRKPVSVRIVGVKIGDSGLMLADAPFRCAGYEFPHIVDWEKGPA